MFLCFLSILVTHLLGSIMVLVCCRPKIIKPESVHNEGVYGKLIPDMRTTIQLKDNPEKEDLIRHNKLFKDARDPKYDTIQDLRKGLPLGQPAKEKVEATPTPLQITHQKVEVKKSKKSEIPVTTPTAVPNNVEPEETKKLQNNDLLPKSYQQVKTANQKLSSDIGIDCELSKADVVPK